MKQSLAAIVILLLNSFATKAQTVYGALAIDRSNGFYYGWAYDYASLTGAENRAIKECKAKGGNCTVVLTWSGKACAVYRTIPGNVGTAYGWGMATTKEAADAIATREALKRSNGVQPTNYVWACNTVGEPKEIQNESASASKDDKVKPQPPGTYPTLIIKRMEWMTKNLDVSTFRNGDPIPLATSEAEWAAATQAGKPMSRYLNDNKANGKLYGRLYNWFAVNDPRGLAPQGYHIPDKEEWENFFSRIGDRSTAAKRLKSQSGWKSGAKINTDEYGFAALPGGNAHTVGSFHGEGGVANFWTSTAKDEKYAWDVALYGHMDYYDGPAAYPKTAGLYVRCIKDQAPVSQ